MIEIAFLCNGGKTIGMGHVMRCLALADEFKLHDCNVCFISSVSDGIKTIRSFGYSVHETNGNLIQESDDLVVLADKIIDINNNHSFDLLIIDSYNVSCDFLLRMKSQVKRTAYIDDLNSFTYPVDILINGNIKAENIKYRTFSAEEVLLLGSEFTLLRQEFRNLPTEQNNSEVKSLLITSGGSDPYNMCVKIALQLLSDKSLAELQFKIVVGGSFSNINYLNDLAIEYPAVTLYHEPKSMSKLMLSSDIAISSAGSTLYELCACGVPSFSFIMAQNQVVLAENMDEQGLVKCLGWYNQLTKAILCSSVKELISDIKLRACIGIAMRKFIDGYGAKRTVDRILNIINNK